MNKIFIKRFLISVLLGIVFGLVCVSLASGSNPDIWGTPQMWSIVFNRFLIGLIVAVVGVHTVHPIFGFRLPSYLRGCIFGALISIDLAIGVFVSNILNQTTIFWLTIIAGAIYGTIIDTVASKLAGQGVEILGKK